MRQSDLAQVDWAGGEKQAVDKVSRERGDENAQVASCSPGGGHSLHQGIHLESSSPGTRCHDTRTHHQADLGQALPADHVHTHTGPQAWRHFRNGLVWGCNSPEAEFLVRQELSLSLSSL